MTLYSTGPVQDLRSEIDRLIDTHGLRRITLLVLRAILRRGRSRPPPITGLSDHLLRDIGMLDRRQRHPDIWR